MAIEEWFGGPVHSLLVRSGFARAEEVVSAQEPLQMFRSRAKKIDVVGCRIAQRMGVEETELYAETGVFLRETRGRTERFRMPASLVRAEAARGPLGIVSQT